MNDLEHDVLVYILDWVPPWDLASVRLVSKGLRIAVRDAGMKLRPNPELLQEQHLLQLCTAFPKATALDLSNCRNLTPLSLQPLQALSQTLQKLWLNGCTWVDSSAITHLGDLPNLSVLSLIGCASLEALPDSLSRLRSLVSLEADACPLLASLPNSISNLSALANLNASSCYALSELPEGIRRVSSLSNLCLMGCSSLAALPDWLGDPVLSQMARRKRVLPTGKPFE